MGGARRSDMVAGTSPFRLPQSPGEYLGVPHARWVCHGLCHHLYFLHSVGLVRKVCHYEKESLSVCHSTTPFVKIKEWHSYNRASAWITASLCRLATAFSHRCVGAGTSRCFAALPCVKRVANGTISGFLQSSPVVLVSSDSV